MEKTARNYGIDLLRIIAMFFVIVLHCLGRGGILRNATLNSTSFKAAWLLEIIAYCAVDIFALISGYVSYNKKTKAKNYINLWFQVVFYCLLTVVVFNIFNPSIVTGKDYIRSFFPVTKNMYWYFTAFTGLYLLKPILDKAINNIEEKDLKKIFIALIIGYSIVDTFIKRFTLEGGYTVIWLVILYILGAIIHKCEIGKKMKLYQSLIGISILVLITYLVKIYGTGNINILKDTFGIIINSDLLINYTSITILGIAILFIIGFSKIEFNNISKKIIGFGASSAFTIYLLNNHYFTWNNIMLDLFKDIANDSVLKIYGYVIGFSLVFVIGSILIDKVRIFIFKGLKIDKLSEKISNLLDNCVTKISNNI